MIESVPLGGVLLNAGDEFLPGARGEGEDRSAAVLGVTYGDFGRLAYFDTLTAARTGVGRGAPPYFDAGTAASAGVRRRAPSAAACVHSSAILSMNASDAAAGRASDWSQRNRVVASTTMGASS